MDYFMPTPRYSVDPVKDAEEELRRAMMAGRQAPAVAAIDQPASVLPKTRKSKGGTLSNNVKTESDEPKLERGATYLSRAMDMYSKGPDITALNEFAQQRAAEGDSAMMNALAAQFAGEDFAPVQAQFLKRASAAQDPLKVGNYGQIAGGKFVADPFAARDAQAEVMLDVGGKLLDNEEAAMREARLARQFASGGGGATRFQQGGPMALPDGTVVQAMFDPQRGYVYNTPQGLQPVPADARPATASMGGPQSANQFFGLVNNINTEKAAITKLDKYLETVGDANSGLQRWADGIAANAKTLFGSKTLTPDQLAAMRGPAQLQALLGLFREDIVGPGVMTEYDAQRVLNALGGDFTALQNPQFVRSILADIRQSKLNRIAALDQQAQVTAPYFPGVYSGSGVPAQQTPAAPAASGGRRVVVDY